MKSLGKQTVRNHSFSDGALIKVWTENRVVYESKGEYYINNLSSKKKITRDTNGNFEAVYNSKTIHSTGIEELFAKIGVKFGA